MPVILLWKACLFPIKPHQKSAENMKRAFFNEHPRVAKCDPCGWKMHCTFTAFFLLISRDFYFKRTAGRVITVVLCRVSTHSLERIHHSKNNLTFFWQPWGCWTDNLTESSKLERTRVGVQCVSTTLPTSASIETGGQHIHTICDAFTRSLPLGLKTLLYPK